MYDSRGLVRHITIWHSISSGRINLLQTGHLNPTKDKKKDYEWTRKQQNSKFIVEITSHYPIHNSVNFIHTPSTLRLWSLQLRRGKHCKSFNRAFFFVELIELTTRVKAMISDGMNKLSSRLRKVRQLHFLAPWKGKWKSNLCFWLNLRQGQNI